MTLADTSTLHSKQNHFTQLKIFKKITNNTNLGLNVLNLKMKYHLLEKALHLLNYYSDPDSKGKKNTMEKEKKVLTRNQV